ncbi:hypothetical protein DFQ26_001053 [Actinomortierella ambigua]|nr:hypothetical protein DFQ26_001053 [Actinomortierella ambigua]
MSHIARSLRLRTGARKSAITPLHHSSIAHASAWSRPAVALWHRAYSTPSKTNDPSAADISEAGAAATWYTDRLQQLNQAGFTAYPRYQPPIPELHSTVVPVRDLISKYQDTLDSGAKDESHKVTINGRIHTKRDSSSKLVWFDVVQDGHPIQAVFSRRMYSGSDEEYARLAKHLHRGDHIQLTGYIGKTKTGQLSVFVTDALQLLSPCLHPLPTKSGLRDPEKRFRSRHLDLLINPEGVEKLRKRSEVIRFIRKFFDDRHFLEVETPILSTQAGGANAKPFATHANALGLDMQMRVAPELYLKQLVIGGMDRVYEMGKQFRNEGIDADHNPEFTTCEFYQAYATLEDLFSTTEDMLEGMAKAVSGSTTIQHEMDDKQVEVSFQKPFRRINIMETLEEKLGEPFPDLNNEPIQQLLSLCKKHHVYVSAPHTVPRIMDKLISQFIEPECIQPTFLWGHPLIMSPLAKDIQLPSGRVVAGRFELFVVGKEIVNAYEELNDPVQQRERFTKQQQDKDSGDEEAQPMDLSFCGALEYGLPPTAGWGMGVDRVCQILTGSHHIRDVLAFPTMRPLPKQTSPESNAQ